MTVKVYEYAFMVESSDISTHIPVILGELGCNSGRTVSLLQVQHTRAASAPYSVHDTGLYLFTILPPVLYGLSQGTCSSVLQ